MRYVIQFLGDALGRPTRVDGQYLTAYDPDTGDLQTTADASRALHFDHPADALHLWRAQSTVEPLRPDGKPNRPLTAFTITVDPVP